MCVAHGSSWQLETKFVLSVTFFFHARLPGIAEGREIKVLGDRIRPFLVTLYNEDILVLTMCVCIPWSCWREAR
jgi:hypothetical protein